MPGDLPPPAGAGPSVLLGSSCLAGTLLRHLSTVNVQAVPGLRHRAAEMEFRGSQHPTPRVSLKSSKSRRIPAPAPCHRPGSAPVCPSPPAGTSPAPKPKGKRRHSQTEPTAPSGGKTKLEGIQDWISLLPGTLLEIDCSSRGGCEVLQQSCICRNGAASAQHRYLALLHK